MAFLVQDKLKADDCNKMVLSMWFKIPQDLPKNKDSSSSVPSPDPEADVLHTYMLMEWAGLEQVTEKRYYAQDFKLFTVLNYDDVLPFHDGTKIGWPIISGVIGDPDNQTRSYAYLPGTPLALTFPIDTWYDPYGPGTNLYFPPIAPSPHVVIKSTNNEFGYYELDPGGDVDDAQTWTNWTGSDDTIWWGRQVPTLLTLYPTSGLPIWRVTNGIVQDVGAEVWMIDAKKFDDEYSRYEIPSCIYISGLPDALTVTVNIRGVPFGPLGPPELFQLTAPPISYPGYTIAPVMTTAAPSLSSVFNAENEPAVGGLERPYVTKGKWHHLLLCMDLRGPEMLEKFVHGQQPGNVARFREGMVMWMLLDGVKYGGDPWPAPLPEELGFDRYPALDYQSIHEASLPADFEFGVLPSYEDLKDQTYASRHGIMVKDASISLPYFKQWERRDPDEYTDYNKPPSSITHAGLIIGKANIYPYDHGWHGGQTKLKIPGFYQNPFGNTLNRNYPVPAAQTDPFTNVLGGNDEIIGSSRPPARTIDIKREYSDVQIWFGKFVDPTKPENLGLFLEITRNPEDADKDPGKLVGNIPKLTQAEIDAYAAAQANDSNVKVLSKAAAPNNLGQPDVYLAGGASSFIHDRGKEGDNMVKTGTIKDTPRPANIPIPESAVKPKNL